MNPLTEFLSEYGPEEKRAAFLGSVAKHLPEQAALGIATAGAAGLIAGAGVGAHALYDAVTKGRDFRKMLSFNEDLAAQHKENPKYVNAAFSTLRRMNSDFSRDPMVAGAFVRQMAATPEAAFGLAGQAAGFAARPGAVHDAALGGLQAGIAPAASLGRQADAKRMDAMFKAMGQPQAVRGPGRTTPGGRRIPGREGMEDIDAITERLRRATGR